MGVTLVVIVPRLSAGFWYDTTPLTTTRWISMALALGTCALKPAKPPSNE